MLGYKPGARGVVLRLGDHVLKGYGKQVPSSVGRSTA